MTSFLEGNLIQIIIVAVITGLAINKTGNKAIMISEFFTSLSEVLANVLCIVLKFAPFTQPAIPLEKYQLFSDLFSHFSIAVPLSDINVNPQIGAVAVQQSRER